jgi:hypothetical protein
MRRVAALALVLALVLPVAAPLSAAGDAPADQRADPPTDRLGWEGGYWHDDPIAVDPSDGLNDTELDRVVSRAMARVEYVRGLEFEERVPVEVISRETYSDRVGEQYSNVSTADRLHQNAKYEALFMLGENESAVSSQQQTTAASVGGFYSPSADQIVIVSENATTPKLNEITLAQELFHALQTRYFDVTEYESPTRELHNARDGIIEGDGNYVDYLYRQRCGDVWNGTCLLPSGEGSGGGGSADVNVGLLYLRYQPYSDGPAFVRQIRNESGWAGVNAVYEDPPASTEQVIHPEKYGVDVPTNVSVPDRSGPAWDVIDTSGSVNYASFGEAGLYTMLWYPGYESRLATEIIPYRSFRNFELDEEPPAIDPFNYSHPYTAGWDGDKLVPYATDDSAATNETGYVWKLAWDSDADAREFVGAYERLLQHHGAERVGVDTWRVPDGQFADAFHVSVSGDAVVITNAPTVDDLSAVRSSVTVEETATDTATATPTATPDATTGQGPTTTGTGTDAPTTGGDSSGGTPGFGVAVALLAVALAALAGWRR